ncbi:MAG TPA: 50S ribosomal protein L10, partial [bacterium]|nr:50S ribosomal protein L10 [bacterium]
RRALEKAGAEYKVIKNTLSKKVIDELKINSGFKKLFTGVTGIVFCKDYIAAAKALAAFEKENSVFKTKGGHIEGKTFTDAQIKELSLISSKEELIGRLVVILNSPIQKIVTVLGGPQKSIVTVLGAVKDKKQ